MNNQWQSGGCQTHRVKLVLVGDSGVGKSSIERRSTTGSFEERPANNIAWEFSTKVVSVENLKIKFDIWDTAGQERYRSLARGYYRGAQVVLVVYDVTNANTYTSVLDWIQKVREICDSETVVVLVGNKVDLAETSRAVLTEETHNRGLDWIREVSQKSNSEIVAALTGNKAAETSRAVLTEDANSYASENGLIFAETSAKTGMGIEDTFLKIAQRLSRKLGEGGMPGEKRDGEMLKGYEGNNDKGGCC